MRKVIKASIPAPLWSWARNLYLENRGARASFAEVYEKNLWQCTESASGIGSTMEGTEAIRSQLPALLARLQVRTLLDAPCGDFHWMSQLELGCQYIGVDIVPAMIATLAQRYPGRHFRVADISCDPLPAADLILCRHCFIHLPFRECLNAVANFRRSGARWLLTTHDPQTVENADVPFPGPNFRRLNLEAAPFFFPAPIELLPDPIREGDSATLALYRLD